jgi:hypothetical protein
MFTKVKTGFGVICCIAIGAFACGVAQALPGQRVSAVVAAVQRKPFFKTETVHNEMSRMPMFNATTHFAGKTVFYHIEDTKDHISSHEFLRYDAPDFAFLKRNDPRVTKIIGMVYDDAVARDFLDAHVVATVGIFGSKLKSTFLHGAHFAYSTSGDGLTLFALKDLAAQITLGKQCAKMECGD